MCGPNPYADEDTAEDTNVATQDSSLDGEYKNSRNGFTYTVSGDEITFAGTDGVMTSKDFRNLSDIRDAVNAGYLVKVEKPAPESKGKLVLVEGTLYRNKQNDMVYKLQGDTLFVRPAGAGDEAWDESGYSVASVQHNSDLFEPIVYPLTAAEQDTGFKLGQKVVDTDSANTGVIVGFARVNTVSGQGTTRKLVVRQINDFLVDPDDAELVEA